METGERLAAYLAGELDADEVRALEADLAREPRLRARLAAIRATDEALAGLPEVAVPAAFSEQLRAAVASELDEQLGGGGTGVGDELAARRVRRGAGGARRSGEGRTWWPQLAAAAAVLAVVGTVSVGVLSGGGDDDAATDEGGEVAMESMAVEPAAGPTVIAAGRSFDTDSLVELADDARFDEIVTQGLSGADASRMADEHEDALEGDTSIAESGPADGGEMATESADSPVTMQAPPTDDDIGLRTVGEVSEADLEAVRRCLPELLEADAAVIPVYVELATFEGADAIVYGLVGNDPDRDSYRRVELWVVDRADCQVLHFAQVDR